MPRVQLLADQCLITLIDLQTSLTPHLYEANRLVDRISFIVRIARLLNVPVITTEQNPDRMGRTVGEVLPLLDESLVFSKFSFDACQTEAFATAIANFNRPNVIVIGAETHICVSSTAQSLLHRGLQTVVCPDAVSARSQERHKLGMERIRDAGVVPAHTESVAYEWLGTSTHPEFRQALAIIKEHP
jgi:nicotinamidase-related amidase